MTRAARCLRAFVPDQRIVRFATSFSLAALMLVASTASANTQSTVLRTVPVAATVRMDGSIKVFQHDRSSFARATKLELVGAPLGVMGGAANDEDYDLTYALYISVLSDGRVTTLSPIGNKIHVFGADGKYQRTLGRNGNGPGEFVRANGNIVLRGDTLLFFDDANMQYSWFHPDKGLIRSSAAPVDIQAEDGKVVGVLSGNRVLFNSSGRVQEGELNSLTRPPAVVSVARIDGKHSIIAKIPDLEIMRLKTIRRKQQMEETRVRTFTPRAHVLVWDSNVATSAADTYRIDIRNDAGTVVGRIAADQQRIPVTRAMREERIDATMERYRNRSGAGEGRISLDLGEIEKIERDTPAADSLPAIDRMFTTRNGTLWVVDPRTNAKAPWTATAFRHDGAIIGRLTGADPSAGFPVAFGDDRVVLHSTDDDGVVKLTIRKFAVAGTR
jgi:hypothetical protein